MTLSHRPVGDKLVCLRDCPLVYARAVQPRIGAIGPVGSIAARWSGAVSYTAAAPNLPDFPMCRHLPNPLHPAVPHRDIRVQPFGDGLIDENSFLLFEQVD